MAGSRQALLKGGIVSSSAVGAPPGTQPGAGLVAPGPVGLRAIPGTKLASDWEGHGHLTTVAIAAVRESLPPDLRWIADLLTRAPRSVQDRDIADVISLGHWTEPGQKHHFMRHASQSQLEAYKLAVDWIFGEAVTAAKLLRERHLHRTQAKADRVWDPFTRSEPARDEAGLIRLHLGNALHALQDSFSAGHVTRDGALVITEIHVYDDANRKGHEEHDKSWKGSDGKLTKIGEAAVGASIALLECVLQSALAADPATEWRRRGTDVMSRYLRARISAAPTRMAG